MVGLQPEEAKYCTWSKRHIPPCIPPLCFAMRTILVLADGHSMDKTVFNTALAAARLLGAHLEFLHVRVGAGDAAVYTPNVQFASGAALLAAFNSLNDDAKARSSAALHHFEELCEREAIEIAVNPRKRKSSSISASWCEEHNNAVATMNHFARHNDLVVVGRPTHSNGLPVNLVERLLVTSGRPLLIVPEHARKRLTDTVLVCWKETPESARALAVALPLLTKSRRVVIVSVGEERGSPRNLDHLTQRLEWDGILADARWLPASSIAVEHRLESMATEVDADLVIMGGYGHGRMREIVFGGCTRHFLDQGDRPVLLMH